MCIRDRSKDDETYCRTAVQNYNRLKPVVLEGDMYRLVSPYGSNLSLIHIYWRGNDRLDVTALNTLPAAELKVSSKLLRKNGQARCV